MAKVLIVEHSCELREALICLLEVEDHTVLWSSNYHNAEEMITSMAFDVILIDFQNQDSARFYLLSRIRQNPDTAKTPVVFLTDIVSDKDKARSAELGLNGSLMKPFDPPELLKLVQKVIRPPNNPSSTFPHGKDGYEDQNRYMMIATSTNWLPASVACLTSVWIN